MGAPRPSGQTLLTRGRMSRVGHNILDENGDPWIGRGYVYGQRELWNLSDSAEDLIAGANCVRIMIRAWGGGHDGNSYSGYTQDAESVGDFGDFSTTYLAATKLHFLSAKAAGLKTILALDSNCGQSGNQDVATQGYCSLYDGVDWQPGQNYFTALGKAQKRAHHVNRGLAILRVLHGLVDFVEFLVEPNPAITGGGQADTNELAVQCMNAWLPEDPNLIYILGGNTYQHGKIADAANQGTVFPTDQIVLTADLLNNSMITDDATWAAAVADFTSARSSTGYPVFCQQAGTQYSSDADGSLMASRLNDLRLASGGSIGWTMWEKVSKFPNSYGPWTDPGDGSGRVVASGGALRRAVVEAAFTASRINPT